MAASNIRNHDYYEELLGAYALDAVTDHEREEMERHLAQCDTCPAELAEHQATVAELALLADEIEPPASLRENIRAAALNAPRRAPTPPRPVAEPISLNRFRERLLPWGMAAVFLIAALGLLAWNIQLRQDANDSTIETIALRLAGDPDSEAGVVYYIPDERVLVVAPSELPRLGPGEVYQVWLIAGGGPIPVGVLTAPGQRLAIAADRSQYQAVALTIEPGPLGSPQPTRDPFIVTPLESS